MTIEQARIYGERAVSAGWPVTFGSLALRSKEHPGGIVVARLGDDACVFAHGPLIWRPVAGMLPDFRDAGTRGHLLQMVRDTCGDVRAFVQPLRNGDMVVTTPFMVGDSDHEYAWGDDDTDAMIEAIETAWQGLEPEDAAP